MACYEVATRKRPFAGRTLYKIMSMVVGGMRPEIPEICFPGIVSVTRRCWEQDPDDRPVSFKDVVVDLYERLEEAGGDPRPGLEPVPGLHIDVSSPGNRFSSEE